jgi:hypothetical protein
VDRRQRERRPPARAGLAAVAAAVVGQLLLEAVTARPGEATVWEPASDVLADVDPGGAVLVD